MWSLLYETTKLKDEIYKYLFFLACFLYQASNPYIVKLSILDDELALNVSLMKLLHVFLS